MCLCEIMSRGFLLFICPHLAAGCECAKCVKVSPEAAVIECDAKRHVVAFYCFFGELVVLAHRDEE